MRILDIHTPLRTGRCCSSGQHDVHVLSDEAQQAKQLRRRLERRCRRTGLPSDKQAYNVACKTARDSIMKSCANHIRSQLQEISGNIRATWRTAKNLLHSRHRVVHNDMECIDLVNKFSDFFTDKVQHIRDNISAALQRVHSSIVRHQTAHRTAVVSLPASDNRQGLEAADLYAAHRRSTSCHVPCSRTCLLYTSPSPRD